MKNRSCLLFIGALLVLSSSALLDEAGAGVDFNINFALPPALVIPSPPEVVLIPRTEAYYVPDIGIDIIFYNGYWFRPHRGNWYRAGHYNGPWTHIAHERMPLAVLDLPPDYRLIPAGHNRIPYGRFEKEWKGRDKAGYQDDDHHDKHRGKGKKYKH